MLEFVSRPATRVLALLELLQDRGLVSAEELADRLRTDARTVRRYVTALREMDIPVEAERGRYGGYRLARSYRLPPLMLGDDEAVAVAVALAAVGDAEDVTEPSPTARALVKLNRVLPTALRERVNALISGTSVVADRRPSAQPEPEVALTLAAAVRARHRMRIEHRSYSGEPVVRDVDPHGLVVHGKRWYLVGHDHLRQEVRTFRVDRIGRATELATRFTPPDGFDVVAHVMHGLTFGAWSHRTEIWLDTDLQTARASLPLTAGDLHEDPDGGVVLMSGAEDLAAMARMLSGLPWHFAVRQPMELAEAVKEHYEWLATSVANCGRSAERLPSKAVPSRPTAMKAQQAVNATLYPWTSSAGDEPGV
ncbi:putative DNA-binding transcriptional regulator YafY [Kribbella sp. VKM Ac-2568]|nr:putative DNA-binding transcriptional regulator YafY [Kribbella sp. VKM Ac-2568]